ncbi:MAG: PEP-CTERM sorting domain-containing protein [Phycisphaeraceae bacterium]
MRRGLKFGIAAAAVLAMAGSASANPQIYLSTSNEDPTISAPTVMLEPGESTTLYIWVIPGEAGNVGREGGLSLSIGADIPGLLTATGAEIYNPQVVPFPPQGRWTLPLGEGTLNDLSVEGSLVQSLTAISATSSVGIDSQAGEFDLDPMYDASTGAFLHAQIEIQATGIGSTDLWMAVGSGRIVVDGAPLSPIFGVDAEATGSLAGDRSAGAVANITVVPEPGSLVLLGLGGLTLLRRRRA